MHGVTVDVGLGLAVGVAVAVGVDVGVAVAVGVGVGVGAPDWAQYLPPVLNAPLTPSPPQTIISVSVKIAVARYKENIKPMNCTSEMLYRLKPVTYRYKKEIDPTQSLAFGLIAEEVADANPDLVACNSSGEPESVHYEMINAMLLNEFLKEHRKVEQMQKQIQTLSAGLQKVSAELQLTKRAPQTANNQ